MTVVGLVLVVTGLGLAARSAQLLMGRGRPKRGPQPTFVIAGPYRRVRNPLMAGLVIAMIGIAMTRASLALGIGTVTMVALLEGWVRTYEEPRLRRRFGRAYEAYLREVPRWIPRRRSPRGRND